MLTLIYPDAFGGGGSADAMQPLALAALAAQTPTFWNLRIFDDRIEALCLDLPADLVAISVLTFTARRAYRIAGEYRKRGVPVIMGGFHPTLLPDEAAEHADCVVRGDAETVWPQVLEDFLAGRLARRYEGGVCTDAELLRFDRSIFRKKAYSALQPVQAARGCRYACDFCSVHSFYGQSLVSRPADAVIAEISGLPGRLVFLTDDNLLAGGPELLPLLRGLRTLGKKWACQISIDAAADLILLREMADAGCLAVFVGFESLDRQRLAAMGKAGNLRLADYGPAIAAFRDAGIMVCGSFVFGYPGDTAHTVREALTFALKHKLTLCHFNTLFPFPETPLYRRLGSEDRLLFSRWWLDPAFRYGQLLFRPHSCGPEELAEACHEARRVFNSLPNIVRRAADRRHNSRNIWNLGAFLLSNMVSRREIRHKQGRFLGEGKLS